MEDVKKLNPGARKEKEQKESSFILSQTIIISNFQFQFRLTPRERSLLDRLDRWERTSAKTYVMFD